MKAIPKLKRKTRQTLFNPSLLLLSLSLLCCASSYAQVTIGSNEPPNIGSLLDLKEDKISDGSKNAYRGLGLPRVDLTDTDNLFPMFEDPSSPGTANSNYDTSDLKKAEDENHIGLLVYNSNICGLSGAGIYVWNGVQWDVLQSGTSVAVETYATMKEYKDRWEELYGATAGTDEPNSNGNGTSTNKVQWHKDQDGNIFFSAMFGTVRWMINNLAAKKCDSNVSPAPTLINGYPTYDAHNNWSLAVAWGYPNIHPAGASDANRYNKRERLGLLYNWPAATGKQNTSMANQKQEDLVIQGICPNGWRLPTNNDWDKLVNELKTNPTKYSLHNSTGDKASYMIKDMCEQTLGTGESKGLLDGGFNVLLAGTAYENATGYGTTAYFWTANSDISVIGNEVAWSQCLMNPGQAGDMATTQTSRVNLCSVRCIQD